MSKSFIDKCCLYKDRLYRKLGVSFDKPALPPASYTTAEEPSYKREVGERFPPDRERPALDFDTVVVFLASTVLLVLFYYYGRSGPISSWLSNIVNPMISEENSAYRDIVGYWYWAVSSVVIRILFPFCLIVFLLKEPAASYGYRRPEPGHWKLYVLMYLFMSPILYLMSFTTSFQNAYPFYSGAGKGAGLFFTYEAAYVIQFFSVEAFFRGFLIFGLAKKLGYYSIFIMVIPYCMIHYGKPMPEVFGSIVAGVVLGYLALESRSWLPGAMLHAGVGISMDIFSLLNK